MAFSGSVSEFEGRLLVYHPTEGEWQNFRPETVSQNWKILISIHPSEGSPCMYLVPTDKHFPEKHLLVEDLTSSSFRFKLSKQVFIQWSFQGDIYGFQCRTKDVAKQFDALLREIKENSCVKQHTPLIHHPPSSKPQQQQQQQQQQQSVNANGELKRSRDADIDSISLVSAISSRSTSSHRDEQDDQGSSQAQSGDEERPLQRINQFQPVSVVKRRCDSIKRSESIRFDDLTSIPKSLESLRESTSKEQNLLNEKIDRLQMKLDMVLEKLSQQNQMIQDLRSSSGSGSVGNKSSTNFVPTATSAAPTPCAKPQNLGAPPPPPQSAACQPTVTGSAPPPPPPPTAAGSAPPPPPPPPTAGVNKESGGPKTLAEQLAAAKLKKEASFASGEATQNGNANPEPPRLRSGIDFSTELQNRILRRQNKTSTA